MTSPMSRQSKFRHIFGDPAKGKFDDIKNAMTSGESQYVKANPRFLAVGRASGGAPIYIMKVAEPGRMRAGMPTVAVHKGKLMDFDFSPFYDNVICSSGDDCSVRVTKFPIEGLSAASGSGKSKSITTADVVCKGHRKKVVLVKWHPCAEDIVASASFDKTVKVWNVSKSGKKVCDFAEFADNLYSLEWNRTGALLATTSKDKVLRVFDPRSADSVVNIPAFDGMKSSKCFWVPAFGWIGSCGFSKGAKRQIKLWDLRAISDNPSENKPLMSKNIDQSASVLLPRMDDDLNVLYTFGKGDGTISYYELVNDAKKFYTLGQYRNSTPQKGGGWMPKRGCDVYKCEVQRFFKLTTSAVIPISFIVPRKSGADAFQEDIYPPCVSNVPAMTAKQYIAGKNRKPKLMSMDPDDTENNDAEEEEEEEEESEDDDSNNNNNKNTKNNSAFQYKSKPTPKQKSKPKPKPKKQKTPEPEPEPESEPESEPEPEPEPSPSPEPIKVKPKAKKTKKAKPKKPKTPEPESESEPEESEEPEEEEEEEEVVEEEEPAEELFIEEDSKTEQQPSSSQSQQSAAPAVTVDLDNYVTKVAYEQLCAQLSELQLKFESMSKQYNEELASVKSIVKDNASKNRSFKNETQLQISELKDMTEDAKEQATSAVNAAASLAMQQRAQSRADAKVKANKNSSSDSSNSNRSESEAETETETETESDVDTKKTKKKTKKTKKTKSKSKSKSKSKVKAKKSKKKSKKKANSKKKAKTKSKKKSAKSKKKTHPLDMFAPDEADSDDVDPPAAAVVEEVEVDDEVAEEEIEAAQEEEEEEEPAEEAEEDLFGIANDDSDSIDALFS